MRIEGVYHYRLAGTMVGREIWSLREDLETGTRYNADILRHDWRTELEYLYDPTGRLIRVSVRRTGDGVTVTGYYEREGDEILLHLTSRSMQGKAEFLPWQWPHGTFFNGHAVSLMRVIERRFKAAESNPYEFPVFSIPRTGLFIEGRAEHGWMRFEGERTMRSLTGEVPCRMYTAKFSRIKGWPFTHTMYCDNYGICHIVTGAAMRFELVELDISETHTPVPLRLRTE